MRGQSSCDSLQLVSPPPTLEEIGCGNQGGLLPGGIGGEPPLHRAHPSHSFLEVHMGLESQQRPLAVERRALDQRHLRGKRFGG